MPARDVGPRFQRKLGRLDSPLTLRVTDRSGLLGCKGAEVWMGDGHIQQFRHRRLAFEWGTGGARRLDPWESNFPETA